MPEAQPRTISIYSGRDRIGHVTGAEKDWRGFDARGNPIKGKFKSQNAAVAAVNLSCPSPCVADARMDGGG